MRAVLLCNLAAAGLVRFTEDAAGREAALVQSEADDGLSYTSDNATSAFADQGSAGRRTKALLVGFQYSDGSAIGGACRDLKHLSAYTRQSEEKGGLGFADVKYVTDSCHERANLNLNPALKFNKNKVAVTPQIMFAAFDWLLEDAVAGDTLYFHYSGHGSNVDDEHGDECDGRDECMVLPKSVSGQEKKQDVVARMLLDDQIFERLVALVPPGVHLFGVVDACHSGTMFDLPWNWNHWDYLKSAGKTREPKFDLKQFDWEWASWSGLSPGSVAARPFPLPGTVTLLSGSQNWQKSNECPKNGGRLTEVLTQRHRSVRDKKHSVDPVLTQAVRERWAWTKTVMTIIEDVTEGKVKAVSNVQVPNFGTSAYFDMETLFSLDAFARIGDESPMQCKNQMK